MSWGFIGDSCCWKYHCSNYAKNGHHNLGRYLHIRHQKTPHSHQIHCRSLVGNCLLPECATQKGSFNEMLWKTLKTQWRQRFYNCKQNVTRITLTSQASKNWSIWARAAAYCNWQVMASWTQFWLIVCTCENTTTFHLLHAWNVSWWNSSN